MSAPSLTALPDEILATIAIYLDVAALVALHGTCKRFSSVINEPSIWRALCQRNFRHWNSRKEFRSWLTEPSLHDWKDIVIGRFRNARSVRKSVDELIENPICRSDTIQAIVDGGYISKDALLRVYDVALDSPNYLAQKYWAWVALGCLHRTTAINEWDRIKFRHDVEDVTERALAALDMFVLDQKVTGDIDDIIDTLKSYAHAIRRAHPDIDDQTPRQKACTIATYLREQKWVGLDDQSRYYNLDNMFLGAALYSSHHNSSPLLSSVIYCFVCRQFGLRAQPCSFPVHVHSVVQPPEGSDLDGKSSAPDSSDPTTGFAVTSNPDPNILYMDVFNTSDPIPLRALQQQLRFLGSQFTPEDLSFALRPASYRDLLVRSAANIKNSITRHQPQHTYALDTESAEYAAKFALATFPTNPDLAQMNLREVTQTFVHSFEHDVHLFRSHILPLTTMLPADQPAYQQLNAHLLRNETERPTPKLRPNQSSMPTPNRITYKIGQVFRHRRAGYLAVIYGWDARCEMSPDWITYNNVDGLPKGRDQPFYNAFVADDKSQRYVAQENVMLLGAVGEGGTGEVVVESDVALFGIQVGKWFRRFDYDRGVFVSNIRDEYPDD